MDTSQPRLNSVLLEVLFDSDSLTEIIPMSYIFSKTDFQRKNDSLECIIVFLSYSMNQDARCLAFGSGIRFNETLRNGVTKKTALSKRLRLERDESIILHAIL